MCSDRVWLGRETMAPPWNCFQQCLWIILSERIIFSGRGITVEFLNVLLWPSSSIIFKKWQISLKNTETQVIHNYCYRFEEKCVLNSWTSPFWIGTQATLQNNKMYPYLFHWTPPPPVSVAPRPAGHSQSLKVHVRDSGLIRLIA